MKQVGFFGGTFNPVHQGHIDLALWIKGHCRLDEVWLSLSPANPLKPGGHPGATDNQRLDMLRLACHGHDGLRAWDGELQMPRPSYTATVLDTLKERHPDIAFRLIIGADNWEAFHRWHRPQHIIDHYGIIVYPRPGYGQNEAVGNATFLADAPQDPISSTAIRSNPAANMRHLPEAVARYIKSNNLYGYTQQ